MTSEVTQILEWSGTDGSFRSLMVVEDTSLPENDVAQKRLEVSVYDSEEDKWKTSEKIDNIDELESYGIPKEFLD